MAENLGGHEAKSDGLLLALLVRNRWREMLDGASYHVRISLTHRDYGYGTVGESEGRNFVSQTHRLINV
jgi:hypothetical protein